jgi:4-hydroxy-tetrahydrodipicolinate reductase
MVVTGTRHGRPLLTFRANWYCSADVEPAWDLRETGWRLQVDGDVPLDVDIRFPVAPEDYASMSPGITAHRAVNTVPVVCAAAPGIRTTVDLPNVVATLA